MEVGLLLLRVVVGLAVAAHGAQKLFGWFGGPGRAGFAGYLESLGFRRAGTWAWIAGAAELFGGTALAVGLLTPLAAAAIIGVMLTAAVVAHAGNGFFAADGGYELPAVIGTVAAAVALTGPGAYALDAVLGLPVTEPQWAAGGIALGLLSGLAVVAVHRLAGQTGSQQVRTA